VNKQIFLFDSDPNKQGKIVENTNLVISSPNKIIEVKPEIVIISSVFWKEIYNLLSTLQKENNISFETAYLDNFHLCFINN